MGKEHEIRKETRKKEMKSLKEKRAEKKHRKMKDPSAYAQIHVE